MKQTTIENTLFSNYQLNEIPLKNRMVMAPLTRCRALNNIPNDLMATYYSQRAGAGLIITEGTSPSINGIGYARIPGIYNDTQVEAWKETTDQVHKLGGKIFLQLMHCGRVAHPDNVPEGGEILAPSDIKLKETKMFVDEKGELAIPTPKEMSISDIKKTIQEYRKAASNAIKAGFDGVEIHGANGYLIDQFFNPASNQRTDKYGGNIENRTRFALEIINEVINEIGSDKVGIRISPYGVMNEMEIYDEIDDFFMYLATQLNRLNIAYIHIADHESMGAPNVPKEIKKKIRIIYNNTIILCGGFTKELAKEAIKSNDADLVAFGRPFIANPDLVGRFTENARLNIPNSDFFYTEGKEGYVDYPYLKK